MKIRTSFVSNSSSSSFIIGLNGDVSEIDKLNDQLQLGINDLNHANRIISNSDTADLIDLTNAASELASGKMYDNHYELERKEWNGNLTPEEITEYNKLMTQYTLEYMKEMMTTETVYIIEVSDGDENYDLFESAPYFNSISHH